MANNKFLTVLLAGVMSLTAVGVQAADSSVMFKIHDIKPVKNSDNLVESCEFSTTFYNNSRVTVSNVSLDLVWKDTVVEGTIAEEKKEATTFRGRRVDNTPSYRRGAGTDAFTTVELTAPISLPPLAPGKQITVKNSVKSDRCFLMLENVEINIKSCRTTGSDPALGANGAQIGVSTSVSENCNGLFKYYSPKDPEFYTDFKPISYDEEAQQERAKVNRDKEEVEDMHEKALSAVRRAGEVVESIAK